MKLLSLIQIALGLILLAGAASYTINIRPNLVNLSRENSAALEKASNSAMLYSHTIASSRTSLDKFVATMENFREQQIPAAEAKILTAITLAESIGPAADNGADFLSEMGDVLRMRIFSLSDSAKTASDNCDLYAEELSTIAETLRTDLPETRKISLDTTKAIKSSIQDAETILKDFSKSVLPDTESTLETAAESLNRSSRAIMDIAGILNFWPIAIMITIGLALMINGVAFMNLDRRLRMQLSA